MEVTVISWTFYWNNTGKLIVSFIQTVKTQTKPYSWSGFSLLQLFYTSSIEKWQCCCQMKRNKCWYLSYFSVKINDVGNFWKLFNEGIPVITQGPVVQNTLEIWQIYWFFFFFAEEKMWIAFALQKLLTFLQQKYQCIWKYLSYNS